MFGFGEAKDARDQVYDGDNQSSISHELLGSAAGFEAMRLWEQKQRKDGKPVSHGMAKEMLAAAAGFEVDKLAETKGMDFVDKEKAKHHAKKQAEQLYDEQYSGQDQFSPDSDAPEHFSGY